jgi:hypothetical protein
MRDLEGSSAAEMRDLEGSRRWLVNPRGMSDERALQRAMEASLTVGPSDDVVDMTLDVSD